MLSKIYANFNGGTLSKKVIISEFLMYLNNKFVYYKNIYFQAGRTVESDILYDLSNYVRTTYVQYQKDAITEIDIDRLFYELLIRLDVHQKLLSANKNTKIESSIFCVIHDEIVDVRCILLKNNNNDNNIKVKEEQSEQIYTDYRKDFLIKLGDLLQEYGAGFCYTTKDDGIHVEFKFRPDINLGFFQVKNDDYNPKAIIQQAIDNNF